jgi:class 3 adenylate cyclase
VGSLGSLKLRRYAAAGATVLVMDIKGFTAGCAAMSAGEVGEWVVEFYARVDAAAAAHGVRKAEVRGDCCVCVAGVEGAGGWDRRVRAAIAEGAAGVLVDAPAALDAATGKGISRPSTS